jgi:predicted O-methyltransferase YrrM
VITSESVERYLRETRTAHDPLLAEMEAHGEREGIPIVMPETGAVLAMLTAACGATQVAEVGTAIGVSTLYIARELPAGGRIVSFEIDQERHDHAKSYLGRAGVADRCDLRLQSATEGLPTLNPGSLDMVFLDGVKDDYPAHVEVGLTLLRDGGVLVADNTLMGGTVADGVSDGHWRQESIDAMRAFNARLLDDPALRTAVLPVGDGVTVAVKR